MSELKLSVLNQIKSLRTNLRDQIARASPPVLNILPNDAVEIVDVKVAKALRLLGSSRSAKRFVIHTLIISIIENALETRKIINKRDIYYQYVDIFESQQVVDQAIKTICDSLAVPRHCLNIAASSKGAILGDLIIFSESGEVTDVDVENGPTSIPAHGYIESVRLKRNIEYILVLEKDAVFRQASYRKDAVYLTGRGYPDLATRRILHLLSETYPDIPVFALVDSDPHGIQIYASYKFGSRQSNQYDRDLICPRLKFLGVSILEHSAGWLALSETDMRSSRSMLQRQWIHSIKEDDVKREVQLGMFLRKKAEMNIVNDSNVRQYLRMKGL